MILRPLSLCIVTAILLGGGPIWASNLNQQLDIQPRNATQGSARDVADQWAQLGHQQAVDGDLAGATQSWREAVAIYALLGDTQAQAQIYSALGNAFVVLGQYPEAEMAFQRRVGTARVNNDPIGVVFGLNNLGSLHLSLGHLDTAQTYFEEALTTAQPTRDANAIGLSLSNLGLLALRREQWEQAILLLEPAANYRLQGGDTVGEANTSNHLGEAYLAVGRTANAIGAFRVGLRLGEEGGDRATQLRAIDGLLTLYFGRGDFTTAQPFLERRAALTLSNPNPDVQTVITLRWLGDYYRATGATDNARTAYSQGLALAR
ncbi:MAG: tetratricopeptide repeat protein, partial [Leptolyngbya sp.]|nr:tetratricopeptide repeat protein [Leptolyngbya sp.]